MKLYPVLLVFLFSVLLKHQAFGTVLTGISNGLYIAIGVPRGTNELIRFDEKLVWHPFSKIGEVELNYSDPEYGLKIRMIGPDGKTVAKTALGRRFGTKFESVQRYEDAFHGWHMGNVTAKGEYDARDAPLSGPLLPSAKELFQMAESGVYTLEIQMQMFQIIKQTNSWTRKLIRFDPVKLKIEKPPD